MRDASASDASRSASTWLSAYTPQAIGLLRIVAALLYIEHGTQKLLNFPIRPTGAVQLLSLLGVAGVLDCFGGLLILIGLYMRVAAFILAGEMAVAYWFFHAPASIFPLLNMRDTAILFCFIVLMLVCYGLGAWSLDSQIRVRR